MEKSEVIKKGNCQLPENEITEHKDRYVEILECCMKNHNTKDPAIKKENEVGI